MQEGRVLHYRFDRDFLKQEKSSYILYTFKGVLKYTHFCVHMATHTTLSPL